MERKHSGGAPVVRNGPSSSLCSDAQSLFFSSPCMLSLSLLCLPQKLLFLFRFLLCCCWWQLLLATLLVTRRNDGGAASNGEGRETRERDELLFFSPILLFFCSFLLFSRQLKSSPFCSSTLLSFSKILPPSSFLSFSKKSSPLVSFFPFPPFSSFFFCFARASLLSKTNSPLFLSFQNFPPAPRSFSSSFPLYL